MTKSTTSSGRLCGALLHRRSRPISSDGRMRASSSGPFGVPAARPACFARRFPKNLAVLAETFGTTRLLSRYLVTPASQDPPPPPPPLPPCAPPPPSPTEPP